MRAPTAALLLAWLSAASSAQAQAPGDDCTQALRYIYVMTAERALHRFHPQRGIFEKIGDLHCGDARFYARPYSMAVGRDGTGWVVMDDGSLFTVSTQDARCTATGFRTGQSGFTTFGMGFVHDPAARADRLYVSTASRVGGVGYKLGVLDTNTLTIRDVGVYDRLSARAELTGTADGRLYGAFEGTPFVVAEIDPQSARIRSAAPQPGVNASHNASNFAFAFWGGDFFLFVGPGAATDVYRYDPETQATDLITHTPLTIVGAGVSTCAPTERPAEDFVGDFTRLPSPAPLPSDPSAAPPPTPPAAPPPPVEDWAGGLSVAVEPPAPGPHPPGEDLVVVAGIRDGAGRIVPLDGGGGTFHVTDPATGQTRDIPAAIRPDGQAEGRIPLTTPGDLQVRFTPAAGSPLTDASSPIRVEVGWGLGFDLSGLPSVCYTDRPCTGPAALTRAGAAASRILADPATRLVLEEDGAPVSADVLPAASPEGPYPVTRSYLAPGTHRWRLRVRSPLGEVESAEHTVEVRDPLVLAGPAEIDLGTLPAGTPTAQSCRPLDLGASTGRTGHQLQVAAEGAAPPACQSVVQLRVGGRLLGLPTVVSAEEALEVCLEVPFCAGDASPPGAKLALTPQDAAFSAQRLEVALRWSVTEKRWLACHGWWLWPTLAGLLGTWVVVGFVRPRRFPAGASIRLAGSLKGLKRASATELRGCPGSAPGFYRDARLGIHGDGSVNGRVRGALALLRAARRGVLLEPRGALEVYDRRRQRWAPPDSDGAPDGGNEERRGRRSYEPSPGETYRIGELYFQIEGG